MNQEEINAFDWQRILMDQYPLAFLLEVLFRGFFIFLIVMISLRITGKRGLKQLSLFELIVILTLGSAGGDVIFYHDVPIVPVIVTFACITAFYVLAVYLIARHKKLEKLIEGSPIYIIEEGRFEPKYMERENFSPEEICMELRIASVEHLGQVKLAILETSGELSIFFYAEEDVRPGMPTLPHKRKSLEEGLARRFYSCARCGFTQYFPEAGAFKCKDCGHERCMEALSTIRHR